MKRRSFLDGVLKVVGGVLGGLVLYPVFRYFVPPKQPEAVTNRTIAAREDELAPNAFKIFPFAGRPAILIRLSSGEYRAFSAVCTHLGCTVQYRREKSDIWCACHNGIYDLQGRNVSGPPPRPLERYEVRIAYGEIVVERPTLA